MIKAIDVIDRLPLELAAALQCDPFFCDIPVVVAERGNVLKEIQRLQSVIATKQGKWGVSVIVLQLVADDEEASPAFGSMQLLPAFQVIELPSQNNSNTGTKKSARKVARKIRDIIKPLYLAGLCTEFVFGRGCIAPITLALENAVGYQVSCHTYEADAEPVAQVALPVFALDADKNITITCPTVGAQIWFTTDDSFPAPPDKVEGSTAKLYSNPITIPPEGAMIRAAAFLPPDIGSVVNRSFFEIETNNP